jgi:hypothetical protein
MTVSLSVIVTSYNAPRTLRECLDSLSAQPLAREIVVADCSPENPAGSLAAVFPSVRFLHFEGERAVPQLRWAALSETRGEIVAAVEGRCVPASDWCAELLRAHEAFPEVPAIGGPVGIAPPASAFDLGLYFSEYGLFCPPLQAGETARLSGANLSYKRAALEESRDLLDAGAWETLLHDRWRKQGRSLRLCPATVVFRNTMAPGEATRQRFHYGRGYAADRVAGASAPARLLYAAASPILPPLLTWRAARRAWATNCRAPFLRSLPWLLFLNAAWAAGEATGYLAGKSPENRLR